MYSFCYSPLVLTSSHPVEMQLWIKYVNVKKNAALIRKIIVCDTSFFIVKGPQWPSG